MLDSMEPQLEQIARQVVAKHGNWRVEFDDMLQEARIAAWEALTAASARGYDAERSRKYAHGAARKRCERCVKGMKGDALWDARGMDMDRFTAG
jgi:hypothetical protein